MAKKKTIDLRSVEPTPVPAGDVNIIYNGTRIAGFSEDTEATLKTGGTRVEHDIFVNYTKPETGPQMGNITIVNNSADGVRFNPTGSFVYESNNTYYSGDSWVDANSTFTGYYIPRNASIDPSVVNQTTGIFISADSDIYTVAINDIPVNFISRDHGYSASVNVNNYENVAITIADKQV